MAAAEGGVWPLLNAYFVCISTVLGAGILALPVRLAYTGLAPLAATLTLVLLMQVAVVLLMVELYQRTVLAVRAASPYATLTSAEAAAVNLHAMGELYLAPRSRALFSFFIVLHLLSILVSYALAGSIAVAAVLGAGVPHEVLIAPFVLGLTAVLVGFAVRGARGAHPGAAAGGAAVRRLGGGVILAPWL